MANWTQDDFDKWYSPVKARVPRGHAEFGNVYSYGWDYFRYGSRRAVLQPEGHTIEEIGFRDSHHWIEALLSRVAYGRDDKALIVGCGIGATVYQILQDYPSAKIWGADTSSYLHSIKDSDAPEGFDTSLIINLDITSPDALRDLQSHTGGDGKVKTIICERVTQTIPLIDTPAWFAACEALLSDNGSVTHILLSNIENTPREQLWTDEGWRWQSIEDWSTEKTNHYFIDASDTSLFRVPV